MEHKLAHLNSRCKELEGHLIDVTLNSSRQLATAVSNVSNANESSVNEKPVTTAKSGSNTVENAAYPRTTHAYTSQYYSGFPKVQSSRRLVSFSSNLICLFEINTVVQFNLHV